ncbi:MAG TPA: TetR/AcrR family transcriptional regulator [Solirubrobacterales bacterium]|nr:TetR/AcrR family transcriptional regulator [Solirubrobacterales bacterium]
MAGGGVSPPTARERLLAAVTALCAEQGYAATSAEQVAARTGVPLATFDANFADLEGCLAAAVDSILFRVMAALSSNLSLDRAERDSVLLAIKAILELLAAEPSLTRVSFISIRQMAPPGLGESLETGARMLSAMLERLADGVAEAAPPPRAARAALGGAEAVVRREIVAGRLAQLPRLLPDFVYAATVPFLGQEEALRLVRRARELLAGTAWV